MRRVKIDIDTAQTLGELRQLLADLPDDTDLTGSVVAWQGGGGNMVLVVGLVGWQGEADALDRLLTDYEQATREDDQ